MTVHGRVKNGVVVVDNPALLPEGAEVMVEVSTPAPEGTGDASSILLRHAGKGVGLPSDLAEHHDHYAHGKPRP